MSAMIGTSVSLASATADLALGDTYCAPTGDVYVYCQASGAITGDGYVVTIDEAYQAAMLTTSNDAAGDRIGVSDGVFADNEYGWIQVYGSCGIRTEQDALANAKLAATADAGQVDDAGATGTIYIEGMTLSTATGAADAVNTTGMINYPIQQLVGTYA